MRTLALAALLVLVAFASQALVVMDNQVHRSGYKSLFTYAAADRDLTTVVVGNPFPMPRPAVERAITDAMQGNHHGPRTRFTTTPSETARPSYRVVMMFDPPATLNTYALCGDPAALSPSPASGGEMRLWTAFCAAGKIVTEVRTRMPRVASPTDPAFRQAVANTTWRLWPEIDPNRGVNECQVPPC